jgi:hypothetical protein
MGSSSIRSMNYVIGTRELNMSQSNPEISGMIATMDAYKAKFGGEALRELYAAKGNDWQATISACRDILNGQKHGMVAGGARAVSMTTTVSQGG